MQIKRFNISKPKKYIDREGKERTQWNNIGIITEFHKDNGSISRIIEIPAISLEANIFPFEPKNKGQRVEGTDEPSPEVGSQEGAINPSDLPF